MYITSSQGLTNAVVSVPAHAEGFTLMSVIVSRAWGMEGEQGREREKGIALFDGVEYRKLEI